MCLFTCRFRNFKWGIGKLMTVSIPYPSGAKCRCVVAGGNVSIVSRFAVVDFLCLCNWKTVWLIVSINKFSNSAGKSKSKLRISGGMNTFFLGGHPEWCTPTVAKASSERDWAPAAAFSGLDNFGLGGGFDFRFLCVISNRASMSCATTLEKSSGPNAHLNVIGTLGLLIQGFQVHFSCPFL